MTRNELDELENVGKCWKMLCFPYFCTKFGFCSLPFLLSPSLSQTWETHRNPASQNCPKICSILSIDCLKGKSTGNHRFSHEIWEFPVIFPLNQPIEISPRSSTAAGAASEAAHRSDPGLAASGGTLLAIRGPRHGQMYMKQGDSLPEVCVYYDR